MDVQHMKVPKEICQNFGRRNWLFFGDVNLENSSEKIALWMIKDRYYWHRKELK